MSKIFFPLLALAGGVVLFFAYQKDDPAALASEPDTTADDGIIYSSVDEEAKPVPSGSMEPVTQWKTERKRLAMLGLRYDAGSVQRVEAEAPGVLQGLTPADVPGLLLSAQAEYQRNDQLKAIATYTRIVLLEPDTATHYLGLGLALRGFKLEDQSLAAFQHGARLDPANMDLAFQVAGASWGRGEFDLATRQWKRMVEVDPAHGAAWGRLARAHFFAERDAEAWEAIHRAQALGESIPAQMLAPLSHRTPEPTR